MQSIFPLIYGAIGCFVGVIGAWFTLRRAHPELQKLRLELDKLKLEKSQLESKVKKETSPIWTPSSPRELVETHDAVTSGSGLGALLGRAGGIKDAALEKLSSGFLEEFNEAIPILETLGLSPVDLQVSFGVTSKIEARFSGKVNGVDIQMMQELVEIYPENKFLITTLKGLQTAVGTKDQLENLEFEYIEVNVQLLPPTISVNFRN